MKLKKIFWTLPAVTMAPIVVLASCGVGNSKEKEQAKQEMDQLSTSLLEKNQADRLSSINDKSTLDGRVSEVQNAFNKLNEKKQLLSETDFNSNKSNLNSALTYINNRKSQIEAAEKAKKAAEAAQQNQALKNSVKTAAPIIAKILAKKNSGVELTEEEKEILKNAGTQAAQVVGEKIKQKIQERKEKKAEKKAEKEQKKQEKAQKGGFFSRLRDKKQN